MSETIEILDYSPEHAADFYKINYEWVSEMFEVEELDKKQLTDPEGTIIEPGGHILFARHHELGVIGTAAIVHKGEQVYELAKMGVLSHARGLKAGEAVLLAAIGWARSAGARKLYLLTNKRCEAAIHLYKKHGFEHSDQIGRSFSALYHRCDVAMKHKDF